MQSIFTNKKFARAEPTVSKSVMLRQAGVETSRPLCQPSFISDSFLAYQASSQAKSCFFGIVKRQCSNTAQIVLLIMSLKRH